MKIIEAPKIELDFPGLAAPGRSPEIPEAQDLYGWLAGSWMESFAHGGKGI